MCPTNVTSTYLQNVPWHCSIDSMISILYLLLVWTNNKSYCWQNINWLFFGLSFPPMFCNCITGRWWAVTDHRVWRLIIIYRAYEYVELSNEYWSTLCILTPGREESSGEYNMHAAGKAQVALLGKWVFECQAESGDMETCIQYKYFFWTYTEHIYFFILQILYNSCIVNMLILNEYLKCQILDIKGEESPQFFPLKTHLMWHNDDTWSTFLCSFQYL